MQTNDSEVCIIGAGVVGLAIAMNLAQKGLSVIIFEKNSSFGLETSSRNSEVIHSGIYYKPGSLKAILCTNANPKLYEWLSKNNIPHKKIGKFIVAPQKDDLPKLYELFERGKTNELENIELISKKKLEQLEPNVIAEEAIYLPQTGIIDSHSLMKSYLHFAKEAGADLALEHKVIEIEQFNGGYEIFVLNRNTQYSIKCKYVINSAGLYADEIAELLGLDVVQLGYKQKYCKGHYFAISNSKSNLVKHLIYPVPETNFTNLGVHITIDLGGRLKLGPDIEYLNRREINYSVPMELKEKFYKAASLYLKNIDIDDLTPDQSGIRPKLQKPGEAPKDFIISEESQNGLPNFINLVGLESPGLTCSIEIGEYVVNKLI